MLRYDIINLLIANSDYQRYLEIGVEDGDAFYKVRAPLKHGVDPASKNATFKITSDEFFSMIKDDIKYDVIFIDGLHIEEQVDRDILNSLEHLSPGGVIVVHDCNPPTEWHQRSFLEALKNGCRQWNGTVWRSILKLRATRNDLDISVIDTDWGCGIIKALPPGKTVGTITLPEKFTYNFLQENRERVLNLTSLEEFLNKVNTREGPDTIDLENMPPR